tara:strand:- start:18 stop:632 length:615 start_codon:yes stop_codon:yes gene_type:complete
MPTDMFFHEKDKVKLINSLEKNNNVPGVVFPKLKFFNFKRCEFKTFDAMAINKKKYSNVKFDGGGDLCLPTLNNEVLDQNNLPIVNVPLWNYDTTFRTRKIIEEDRARFARAWFREFKKWDDRGGETAELAYKAWIEMIKTRLPKQIIKKTLNDHPKFIQQSLADLKKEQFGFDCFGLLNEHKPGITDYFNFAKTKIKYPMINM